MKKRREALQSKEIIQKTKDILECEDGLSFEEKKAAALKMLDREYNTLFKREKLAENSSEQNVTDLFWKFGNIVSPDGRILLRKIAEADKEKFTELEYKNSIMPSMYEDKRFVDSLWEDHLENTALRCSIIKAETDEYLGYCGIKNILAPVWEIEIELMEKWKYQGFGYLAMQQFLNTIVCNIGVSEFRIRIDSDNYASQRLFEKLGSTPNGVSEFLLHDEESIRQCEEDYLNCIDDRLKAVAKKFDVEPRTLISHVLEYKLVWEPNKG